jgi:hypothetical protein
MSSPPPDLATASCVPLSPLSYNRLRVFRNAKASRCGYGMRQARQTKAVW